MAEPIRAGRLWSRALRIRGGECAACRHWEFLLHGGRNGII